MTIQRFNMQIAGKTFLLLFDLEPEFYSDQVLGAILPKGVLPEPEVVNTLPHLLKPGDTCVDAGANIGFFTILMSKLVGETGAVLAVEADPRNAAKLRRNLDLNDCRNVRVHTAPLARVAEMRTFHLQGENGSSTLYAGADPSTCGELVRSEERFCTTLSEIVGERRPVLLKMDVEGAELETIEGASCRFPFVISELNEEALTRGGASIAKLRFRMEAVLGYRTHLLSETGGMPAMLAPHHAQKIVPTRPNANVLFAREWDVVRAWPEVRV